MLVHIDQTFLDLSRFILYCFQKWNTWMKDELVENNLKKTESTLSVLSVLIIDQQLFFHLQL